MASVVVRRCDERPAREPTATCDRCGRRGTYARVTRHTEPPEVRRFCLRCWPAAHREAIERRNTEVAAALRPSLAPASIRGRGALLGQTAAWHWLAALGTHWRYFRYER